LEPKVFCECFLCKREFRFGPHIYDGKNIPNWGIMICLGCLNGNWDGIVPDRYPHLIEHLKSQKISIQLNAKGWIDIPT
jgi:hypothetical protein